MKRKQIILLMVVIIFILIIGLIIWNTQKPKEQENTKFKIVTTFYPIYIMASNITQGANEVDLVNMTDRNVGCLHDYTLSTADMKKIENANVLIQNGLGLENFMDKIIATYSNLSVINTSTNITSRIEENNETNPHVWTSLSNYMLQVEEINEQLKQYNPENATIYQRNAEEYLQKLQQLKIKYDTQLSNLTSKKAVCLNEAFSYLTKEIGLQTISVPTDHEESSLSAEGMKNLITQMKQENIKIIIVDSDDNLKNAQTLANETGAKIYELNSGLTGNLEKDAYLNSMNSNFEVLKSMSD